MATNHRLVALEFDPVNNELVIKLNLQTPQSLPGVDAVPVVHLEGGAGQKSEASPALAAGKSLQPLSQQWLIHIEVLNSDKVMVALQQSEEFHPKLLKLKRIPKKILLILAGYKCGLGVGVEVDLVACYTGLQKATIYPRVKELRGALSSLDKDLGAKLVLSERPGYCLAFLPVIRGSVEREARSQRFVELFDWLNDIKGTPEEIEAVRRVFTSRG